jgi:hypothetical protein
MPPKGGSRRSRAAKAVYSKRERNEFNELIPGPTTTTKKTATETTEAPESTDPVIQIVQAVRVLASQDLGDRDKRAVVKEIGLQLMVVNAALTEAQESAQKNQELEEILIAKIDALPPALSREQQCMLEVLEKVNASSAKPLSAYLIRERLCTDHKKKLTKKKKRILALQAKLERAIENNKKERDKLVAKKRAMSRTKQNIVSLTSPENEQKIAQKVVFNNIKEKGKFTPAAKRKIVELGGEARSLSAAPKALKAAIQLCLPHTDEADIDKVVPCRKSLTEWTVLEPEYDQVAAIQQGVGSSKFGVLADGSKRARKDLFCVAIFWFCMAMGCVFTKLVNIVDLQHDGSAEAMSRALAWTLAVRCGLNIKNMIYFCTDNTNSMSGRAGGCVALLSHGLDITHDWCREIPRAPCVLHVWHLAIRAMRPTIYFGALPSKLDRSTRHLWNFLYACAKLFNKAHSSYTTWKKICADAGKNLTITWMPVDTRWLFECFAAKWALENLALLRWLYDELVQKFGKKAVSCTSWKNIHYYINNVNYLVELYVFHAIHTNIFMYYSLSLYLLL